MSNELVEVVYIENIMINETPKKRRMMKYQVNDFLTFKGATLVRLDIVKRKYVGTDKNNLDKTPAKISKKQREFINKTSSSDLREFNIYKHLIKDNKQPKYIVDRIEEAMKILK